MKRPACLLKVKFLFSRREGKKFAMKITKIKFKVLKMVMVINTKIIKYELDKHYCTGCEYGYKCKNGYENKDDTLDMKMVMNIFPYFSDIDTA